MNSTPITASTKTPDACTKRELRGFEQLVRQGFGGSDEGLPDRTRGAHRLAFHFSPEGELVAIAGLKDPDERYRIDVFERSRAGASAANYPLELGWVYVVPEHRGKRLGERLCRRLLEDASSDGVFATTRPDNEPMIQILRVLGFAGAGEPFRHPRRDEELVLFLRKQPTYEASGALV